MKRRIINDDIISFSNIIARNAIHSGHVSVPGKRLNFDAQTGAFTVGNTITGGTSGAIAIIKIIDDGGTTGTLYLENISGTFQDNEIIYEASYGGELVTNGTMEADANWDNYGVPATNERSIEQKVSGSYSRKLIANSTYDGIQSTHNLVTVSGSFYKVVFNTYPVDINPIRMGLRDGANSAWLINEYITSSLGSFTQTTRFIQDTGAGGPGGWIQFQCDYRTSGTWYIDDVSVKQITNAALVNGTLY